MSDDSAVVTIGSFVFDGATPDIWSNVFSWSKLDGWFDSPQISLLTQQRAGLGLVQSVNDVGGRVIALSGAITALQPGSGGVSRKVGVTGYASMRILKAAVQALFAPIVLTVDERDIELHAAVWQTGPIHFDLDGSGGDLVAVRFQIPLIAPDPRRYNGDTTQALTAGHNTVTNAGDLPTPVVVTVTGADNPTFQNTSIQGEPELLYEGAAGNTVVINTDTESVTESGAEHRSKLVVAQWWQLLPGANDILVSDDCSIAFSAAYS